MLPLLMRRALLAHRASGWNKAGGAEPTYDVSAVNDVLLDCQIISESLARPDAFESLVRRHVDSVYGFCAARWGRDLAHQITPDVFFEAFRTRDRFNLDAVTARPWLFGISLNLARKHFRDNDRAHRLLARSAAQTRTFSEVDWESIDRHLDVASVSPLLGAALMNLSRADEEILLLTAWEQLTYEEISEVLDIPLGTVRSRLSRARQRLRAALSGDRSFNELVGDNE